MDITRPGNPVQPTAQFHQQVPAHADALIPARQALGLWTANLGLEPEAREDVVLAGYEAMANAAEHAYRNLPAGTIDILATHLDNVLTLTVTDYGTWKTPEPPDEVPTFRGRGLDMINYLADTSELTHRTDGTTMTMSWNL